MPPIHKRYEKLGNILLSKFLYFSTIKTKLFEFDDFLDLFEYTKIRKIIALELKNKLSNLNSSRLFLVYTKINYFFIV
jgi:hypothetical protein